MVACPDCGADLTPDAEGMVACSCGMRAYAGYVQEYGYLSNRTQWLRERINEHAGPPDATTARAYGLWGSPSHPPPPAKTGSPQILLVTIGAGLLLLAALVFVAVAWETIGPWGQIVSLLLLTGALTAGAILARRGMHGTAEALAVVAFGTALISVVAAPTLGALPRTWDQGNHPYYLVALTLLAAISLGLGRRFAMRAWCWAAWLLTPLLLALAVALATRPLANDQITMTLAGLSYLTLGFALLRWARRPDALPMRVAGAACVAFATALTIALMTYEPPAGALLVVTGALLATVLGQVHRVGWPLFAFWLALLAMFAPPGPASTAAVGIAGAVLLLAASRAHTGPALAVLTAGTLWTTYYLGSGGESLSILSGIAGAALLAFALLPGAAPIAWFGAALLWATFLLEMSSFPFFEVPTLVLAALFLAAGQIARRAGSRSSALVYGPAISAALIPSAVLCWWDVWSNPALIRFAVVMVTGIPLLVVGVRRRMAGLVIPSSVGVSIAATAQIFATLNLLPRWLALAVAGAILITIGARLEWMRERSKQTERWLQSLN